ncbi:MAG: rod shape-determining protein MreC [bacterium]
MKEFNQSIIIAIITILIAGLIIPDNYFIAPVRSFCYQAIKPVNSFISGASIGTKNFFNNFLQIDRVLEENQKLEEENANLIAENVQISNLEYENQILREQLNFVNQHKKIKIVGANIIAKDPDSFLQTFTISIGEKHGVKVGQAVILNSYLIGKIEKSFDNHSNVLLITNRESVINSLVLDSRANGVVIGGLGFGLIIESIPQDADIKLHDKVITSGLSKDIPFGLIVGQISEIISDESEIFKRAAINSPINFSNLETVFVIIDF